MSNPTTTTESHEIRVTIPAAHVCGMNERSVAVLAADNGGKIAARLGGHPGRPDVTLVVAFGDAEDASYEFEDAVHGEWYTFTTEQRLGWAAKDRNGAVVVVGDRVRFVNDDGEEQILPVGRTGREEPWLAKFGDVEVTDEYAERCHHLRYDAIEVAS